MKNYNEIAKSIFERRDKYLSKKKSIKKLILGKLLPTMCFCLIIVLSAVLVKSGIFKNDIKINEDKPNDYSTQTPPSNDKTPDFSDGENTLPPKNNPDTSGGENTLPPENNPDTSGGTEENPPSKRVIDSIDKMNFYSAKKIIEEQSFLPVVANECGITVNLSNTDIAYDKEFSIYKITYFNICINSADSFLARKLGGTGLVEVVVVDTDILNVYKMLTFKLGNNYYTCLMSEVDGMNYTKNSTDEFNTTRYTSGFDVLKNNEQENYSFSVRYEGSQVVGFESTPFNSATAAQGSEEITFVDDYCVVIFTNETVTISQLESYVRKFNSGDLI